MKYYIIKQQSDIVNKELISAVTKKDKDAKFVTALELCDIVILLKNWNRSSIAVREWQVAEKLSKQCKYEYEYVPVKKKKKKDEVSPEKPKNNDYFARIRSIPDKYTDLEGQHHSSMERMCAKYGIGYSRFHYLVHVKGYSIEDALRIMIDQKSDS